MSNSITIDVSSAISAINSSIVNSQQAQNFLQDVVKYGKQEVQKRLQTTKTDPTGALWAPWSVSQAKYRNWRGNASLGILYDTGSLFNSINTSVTGAVGVVETSHRLAAIHQDGRGFNPVRKFMGWSDENIKHINDMFAARFGGI